MRRARTPPVIVVSIANAVSGIAISWLSTGSAPGAAPALAVDHEVVTAHRVLEVSRSRSSCCSMRSSSNGVTRPQVSQTA